MVDADARKAESLKARSAAAVREAVGRGRKRAKRGLRQDDDDDGGVADKTTSTAVDGAGRVGYFADDDTIASRAREIATRLNVPLPMWNGTGANATDVGTSVGACGATGKTDAEEREIDEDEWDDVEMDDYGMYVADDGGAEEDAVMLRDDNDEDETKTKTKTKTKKKPSRRLTDDERTGLLSTHHTHVMCLIARGRLVSAATGSRLLQALTASCAPKRLVETTTTSRTIEVHALSSLVDWFAGAVSMPIVIDDDDGDDDDETTRGVVCEKLMVNDAKRRRRAFRVAAHRAGKTSWGSAYGIASRLSLAWSRRGQLEIDEESCAALFAALCQGLGLTCRVIASLEPVPIRASAARLESLGVLANARVKPIVSTHEVKGKRSDDDGCVRHWCEVLCARHGVEGDVQGNTRWVSVAPRVRGSTDDVNIILGNRKRGSTADASSSMPYVMAFHSNLGARDVTRKYALAFSQALHHRTPDWKWWERITSYVERINRDAMALDYPPDVRACIEAANAAELFEMDTRSAKERVPGTMSEIKNHPLWVVDRFLSRSQIIHPRHPVKGFIAGEAVFPRSCVKELKSAERWKSECRRRVTDESLDAPIRKVHSRALQARVKALTRTREAWFAAKSEGSKERLESEEWRITMSAAEDCPADPSAVVGDIALYGEWQTEPWTPPAAVGGIVPKNDRGNVDLYGNALPPPGTVHVTLARISKTARAMNIDYAPALVGFEYKAGGKTLPVFNGVVICEEFKEELLKQHELAEEARAVALEAKLYKDACLKWRLLLGAMWTRAALREEFQPTLAEPAVDHTAARIAAAKAMNDGVIDISTTSVVVEPLAKTLGAQAVVEEL